MKKIILIIIITFTLTACSQNSSNKEMFYCGTSLSSSDEGIIGGEQTLYLENQTLKGIYLSLPKNNTINHEFKSEKINENLYVAELPSNTKMYIDKKNGFVDFYSVEQEDVEIINGVVNPDGRCLIGAQDPYDYKRVWNTIKEHTDGKQATENAYFYKSSSLNPYNLEDQVILMPDLNAVMHFSSGVIHTYETYRDGNYFFTLDSFLSKTFKISEDFESIEVLTGTFVGNDDEWISNDTFELTKKPIEN